MIPRFKLKSDWTIMTLRILGLMPLAFPVPPQHCNPVGSVPRWPNQGDTRTRGNIRTTLRLKWANIADAAEGCRPAATGGVDRLLPPEASCGYVSPRSLGVRCGREWGC
jgi:hypothetical protein